MQTPLAMPSPGRLPACTDAKARFRAGKDLARRLREAASPGQRLDLARAFCRPMVQAYFAQRTAAARLEWPVSACPLGPVPNSPQAEQLAVSLGRAAAAFDDLTAGYLLGTVYTAMLPSDLRSRWGAFYTPPQYVERLLDQAAAAGIDWARASIADPACGGGAFLAPVALRMWAALPHAGAELALDDIASRLRGFELDPFAAWMSHVTLEAALLPLCAKAGRRMPIVITVGDSMRLDLDGEFDLVVGNPPYGKVKLTDDIRQRFGRSLYGHPNLYGLFTDLAVSLCKPGGVVAFVTPTSFLGGQYFKSLRRLLLEQAPAASIDFIAERQGIFDDVLQETLLAVFVRGASGRRVAVCSLETGQDGRVQVRDVDRVALEPGDGPWSLPRSAAQAASSGRLRAMRSRLRHYGYGVSTGPLVWNRHKPQLRQAPGEGMLPLIWAESVGPAGFSFSAQKKNHEPYFAIRPDQGHLVMRAECVLVQRTTAKEQERRLVCAVLPKSFVARHEGVVVENHLNIVRPLIATEIEPATIAAVLNSRAADHAFRCISGSVAVSAYELEALPMPGRADMLAVQEMLASGASGAMIERRIDRAYGLAERAERKHAIA